MPNLTPNLAWFADQIPFVWQLTIAAMFDSDSVQFKLHSCRNAQRLNTLPNTVAPIDSVVIDVIHNN